MNAFKSTGSLVILVLAGLISANEAEDPKVGSCTLEEFTQASMKCEVEFVRKLQKSKNEDCNEAFNRLVDCSVNATRKCFEGIITDPALLNKALENARKTAKGNSDVYCGKGAFKFPDNVKNSAQLDSICGSNFYTKLEACPQNFMKQFKDDWTSSKMCRLYAESNQCSKKLLLNCKFDDAVKKHMEKAYDRHFNPWCSSAKDPQEFISGNAAGAMTTYWTLLATAAVGSCTFLLSA